MLNTDSGKSRKVFSLKPELVFNLNQNRCSDWIRMAVQDEPEYAHSPRNISETKFFDIFFARQAMCKAAQTSPSESTMLQKVPT
jgi:hypothetical protein